jgi:hypothetical protein
MSSDATYADWRSEDRWRSGRCWRPLEIAAVVGAFILFWPVGIALLIWKFAGYPSWRQARYRMESTFGGDFDNARREFREFRRDMKRDFRQRRRGGGGFYRGTGNIAFEEYRERELARLEEERRKLDEESRTFAEFVEELKRAKDREEFDAYMARRRSQAGQAGGNDVPPTTNQA